MRTTLLWMLVLAGLGYGARAQAQEDQEVRLRTVLVQDGKIFIDGRPIPPGQIPSLPAPTQGDGTLQVTWIGELSPIFPLRGQWFRVDQDRLVPHHDVRIVRETEDVRSEIDVMRSGEMARRVALETYARGLREENRALFGRINAEERMEYEAQSLAYQIRGLAEGAERAALITELRSKLERILEMKHENRLAEIRELEHRLEGLRNSLREREGAKKELVDRRLQELINP